MAQGKLVTPSPLLNTEQKPCWGSENKMHLNTTEEMNRASDVLTPYMQYTPGKGWNVKPNASKKIKKLQETSRALWNEMTEAYYDNDCMQSVGYTKEKGFEVCSDAPEKIKNLHRTLQELLDSVVNKQGAK